MKQEKRKISKRNILLAFTLATIVFFSGLFIGQIIIEKKYTYLSNTIDNAKLQTQSLEVQYELLKENPCDVIVNNFLTEEIDTMGERLTYLENIYGKSANEIITLKQQYSLLQIRHWLFYKSAKDKCSFDIDLILYFYSNKDCNSCEKQGTILSAFKENNQDEVNVYSFDIELNNPAIDTVKNMFGVNEVPAIVYNNITFKGFVSMNQLNMLNE